MSIISCIQTAQKKAALILLGILIFQQAHTEILVIKTTKKNNEIKIDHPSEDEWNKIYEILGKYSWPMCLASKLSDNDIQELFSEKAAAEEAFIQKKLEEINKSYKVIFIPTVVYELFCLLSITTTKNSNLLIKKHQNEEVFKIIYRKVETLNEGIKKIMAKKNATFDQVYKLYRDINNDSLVKYLHWFVNKKLALYIRKQKILDNLNLLKEKSKKVLTNIFETLSGSKFQQPTFYQFEQNKHFVNFKKSNLIPPVVDYEYEARKNNAAFILRGTSGMSLRLTEKESSISLPDSPCFISNKNRRVIKVPSKQSSLSYGNSLFAGFVYDITACTYNYYKKHSFGYALKLNKKNIFSSRKRNSDSTRLFFISPLGTLPALFAHGEFFHSRSIAYSDAPQDKAVKVTGVSFTEKFIDSLGLIRAKGSPALYTSKFLMFCAENFHILYFGEDEDKSKEAKKYKNNFKLVAKKYLEISDQHKNRLQKSLNTLKNRLLQLITKLKSSLPTTF